MNTFPETQTRYKEDIPQRIIRFAIIAVLIISTGSSLPGQTEAKDDEPVYELSPFEVSTTEGAGSYRVEDTLAASRLRSDVKDIGAAITILPKDILQDLGASDVMQVADFVPSVEALKNEEDGADDNNGVFRPVRYRIRGLFTESVSRNYHAVSAGALPPPDTYNVGRVTFSSGANSILFGSANPAGIVNTNTLQPILGTRSGKLLFRTDNYGTSRVELDYNLPVMADKLAFRMILLTENRENFPEPAWYDQDRVYLAGRYNITEKTSIVGNFEFYEYARNQANWAQYINRFGVWEDAGSPLVPWTSAKPTQPGITAFTWPSPQFIFGTAGQINLSQNWRNHPQGAPRLVTVRNFQREPAPLSLTGTSNLVGNMRIDEREGWVSDIAIEHKFTDKLQTQLAFFFSEMDQDLWTTFSNPNAIYIDAASTSLNEASSYPDAGRYFIRGHKMERPISMFESSSIRWTTAYEVDLRDVKEFLGRHQFAFMFEHREGTRKTDRKSLYNTNPAWPYYNANNPQANINRPQAIVYLEQDSSGRITGSSAPDTRELADYYSAFDDVTAEWKSIQAGTWFESRQRSYLGVVQSHFLKDRVVTTLGYRIDQQDAHDLAGADWQKDAEGWYLPIKDLSVRPSKAEDLSGIEEGTYSIGAVWHLLRNRGSLDYMSFSFNKSTNFEPAPSFPTFQGGFRGPSTGETEDFGVRFIMLDESLSINVNFFESGQRNARLTGVGFMVDEWNNVWERLDTAYPGEGFLDKLIDEQARNGDTFDSNANGIELSMTYNPFVNWRIYISASKNDTQKTNIAPGATRYMDDNADLIRTDLIYGGLSMNPGPTVRDTIDDIESDLEVLKAQDGSQPFLQPEYKFNLVTHYGFREGFLKGFAVGGSLLWQDKGVIGWARDDSGKIEVAKPFYGESFLNVGFSLSVTKKFSNGKYVWFTQLNINNLLDDTDPRPLRAEEDADNPDMPYIISSNFRPGRTFTLTTSLKF